MDRNAFDRGCKLPGGVSVDKKLDNADLHWLYRETVQLLTAFERAVERQQDLGTVLATVQYFQWSGLIKLLERSASDGPLKVDGSHLRWKCREIEQDVREAWKKAPPIAAKDVEALHRKLDLIAGRLAHMDVRERSSSEAVPSACTASERSERLALLILDNSEHETGQK